MGFGSYSDCPNLNPSSILNEVYIKKTRLKPNQTIKNVCQNHPNVGPGLGWVGLVRHCSCIIDKTSHA